MRPRNCTAAPLLRLPLLPTWSSAKDARPACAITSLTSAHTHPHTHTDTRSHRESLGHLYVVSLQRGRDRARRRGRVSSSARRCSAALLLMLLLLAAPNYWLQSPPPIHTQLRDAPLQSAHTHIRVNTHTHILKRPSELHTIYATYNK